MDPGTIHLRSPLSLEECAARITAAIDPEPSGFRPWSSTALDKPVVGIVEGTSVRLRKRILYRNSFQAHLSAELQRSSTGTTIAGTVGLHPFVRVFMVVWFAGVILVGGSAFLMVAAGHTRVSTTRRTDDGWMPMLIPPGMLVFGVCLVALGRGVARSEADYLTDFMVQTLDAEKVPEA